VRVVHLERSTTRFVTACAEREPLVIDTRAELERVVDGGTESLCAGPPAYGERLDAPPADPDLDEATARVAAIARTGSARVAFSSYTSLRTIRSEEHSALRAQQVWALIAEFSVPGGRPMQVGWSGRGSALGPLTQFQQHMEWLRRALVASRPFGSCTVEAVLSPQAAAVLLHEAVGHLVEAAGPRTLVGVRVASDLVSIADDPLAAEGPGSYTADDEGVEALGPLAVVREGIIAAELHSLESARAAGELPTGNGRAASAWHAVIPRVANLVCHAGTSSADALLDAAGHGIYVHQLRNGISNGSRVQAEIVVAERIAHGRLTGELLSGAHIDESAGVATRIAGVGDEKLWNPNSMCGKGGQLLFNVGTAAPALHVARLRIAA
jgi:TldD protein